MQRADYRQRLLGADEVVEQAPGNAPGDTVRSAAASLPAS